MSEQNPLYDKHITCLVCNHTFTTKKVRSRFIQAVSLESDFYSDYKHEDLSPLLYHVNVCPSCGYAFADEAATYFLPGAKDIIMQKITRFWRGQSYYSEERTSKEAIEAYKLAIYSGILRKEKPIVMAGLYMRLAWIYRKLKDETKEIECLNLALKSYEQSYFQGDYKDANMSLTRILYLMGELYRQTGNPNKAIVYFSKVIQLKDKVIEKRIVELARDQWMLIREEMKQERMRKKAFDQAVAAQKKPEKKKFGLGLLKKNTIKRRRRASSIYI
ncbi:DUF2225 domain-containing protein [Bacillus tianshenii]|nr:DUF2225 domain-containing protein [Bacillus tianshenii]